MHCRKRIDNVEGPELEALQRGFQRLQDSGELLRWADIHKGCPHQQELFLPWHRAFLFEFEKALRAASGTESVTLPYWDWLESPFLPLQVRSGALFHKEREPDATRSLPKAEKILKVQGFRRFKDYGGTGPPDSMVVGELEQEHTLVHNWVGGDMADPDRAGRDPIFYLHHAFVDKLWAEWQDNHTDGPAHVGVPIPAVPGQYIVQDVLSISGRRLGYEYVDDYRILTQGLQFSRLEPALLPGGGGFVGDYLFLDVDGIRLTAGQPPEVIEVTGPNTEGVLAHVSFFGSRHRHVGSSDGEVDSGFSARALLGLLPTFQPVRGLRLTQVGRGSAALAANVIIRSIALVSK